MTNQADDIVYALKIKDSLFEFCCKQYETSKNDKIKFSDCKEQFKTIHPTLLNETFDLLMKEKKLEVVPGRIVTYKLNMAEMSKINEKCNTSAVELVMKTTHLPTENSSTASTKEVSQKRKLDNVSVSVTQNQVSGKKLDLKPVLKHVEPVKVFDRFTSSSDNSENRPPAVSTSLNVPSINESVPVKELVKPVAKSDFDDIAVLLRLLVDAFDAATARGDSSVTLDAVKSLVEDCTSASPSLRAGLEGHLQQLEAQNKIMVYGDEVIQI